MERFQILLDLSHEHCLQKLSVFQSSSGPRRFLLMLKREFCLSYNLFAMYGNGNVILYLCRLLVEITDSNLPRIVLKI